MPYLTTALGWLLLLGAVAHGWAIWSRRAPHAGRRLVLAAAVVVLWPLAAEAGGTALFTRWPALAALEWPVPMAALVLALFCLAAVAPERVLRRPLLVLVAAAAVWDACIVSGPALLATGCWALSDDHRDACLGQTVWWSCGPAAVASLTCRLGQPLSEAEAARACATWPTFGTFPAALAAGLRRAGYRTEVNWHRPLRTVAPGSTGLAYVLHRGRVVHVVAVVAVTPDAITVVDPSAGEERLARGELAGRWLGVYVEVTLAPVLADRRTISDTDDQHEWSTACPPSRRFTWRNAAW